jgi:hypothetical protein
MTAFITDYSRTLQANEEVLISCAGATSVRCLAGDAGFTIKPDDKNPVSMELGIGFTYKKSFDSIRIKNGSTAQTIKLAIGDGVIEDNRLVGQVDISGGLRQAANRTTSYGNAIVGIAALNVVAANTSRSTVLIQNLGPGLLYHGTDNTVTTVTGIQIPVGSAVPFTHDDDVYLIADTAGTDVRYLEETL